MNCSYISPLLKNTFKIDYEMDLSNCRNSFCRKNAIPA